MIQIRKSVFETNSSSIHAICISRKKPVSIPNRVIFQVDEFGWENDVANQADYLYTAIMYCSEHRRESRLEKLEEILSSNGVECIFVPPRGEYSYYIDHGYELEPLIDDLLSDEDKLLRYLFSEDSVVYTGNDNQDIDNYPINCLDPQINCHYDRESGKWLGEPNPNHRPDLFEYFEKGN